MHQIEDNFALLEEDEAMTQPILTFNSRKRRRCDDLTFNENDCIRILTNGEYLCDIPCPDRASYQILSQHRTRSRVAMEHQDVLTRIEQIYKIIMETNCITTEIRSRLNNTYHIGQIDENFQTKNLSSFTHLRTLDSKKPRTSNTFRS